MHEKEIILILSSYKHLMSISCIILANEKTEHISFSLHYVTKDTHMYFLPQVIPIDPTILGTSDRRSGVLDNKLK